MSRGQCLCGAVAFEVEGEPSILSFCHCSLCRRSVGATPVAWATYPMQSFAWVRGTPAWYRSSSHAKRAHCADCGTSLAFASARTADEIDVTIATLDDAELHSPTHHIWVPARLPWSPIAGSLPQHVGDSGSPLLAEEAPEPRH